MRADLILPVLLLLGTQPPSGDPPKPATPVQEAEPKASLNLDDLRALLAARRFEEAAEGARSYLADNPEWQSAVTVRVILCSARLEGHLPPPVFENPVEPGSSEPLRVGREVRPPQKIYGQGPTYSDKARKAKINGAVLFDAVVDHEGCIQIRRLLRGLHPDLDASARWALERWVFRPATLNGKPVAVYYTLTMNFQVQ